MNYYNRYVYIYIHMHVHAHVYINITYTYMRICEQVIASIHANLGGNHPRETIIGRMGSPFRMIRPQISMNESGLIQSKQESTSKLSGCYIIWGTKCHKTNIFFGGMISGTHKNGDLGDGFP